MPLEDFRAELSALMVAAESKIREFVASAQQSIAETVATVAATWAPGTLELIAMPAADEAKPASLTVADVVKRVRRQTVFSDKGATRTVESPLSADEVLTWHDHGSHIVVVTADGQKFSSADAE